MNVTFFTPVGLRRNNSRTLRDTVNIFTTKERGRKNGGFHLSTFPVCVPNRGWRRNEWNKTERDFFTPVGLRRNISRTNQATVNILTPKERGRKNGGFIRAHFHFSFLIGGGEGTNGIKLNLNFFNPVSLQRNNSRTLQ